MTDIATPAAASLVDFTALKLRHRAVWASGEYDRIARGLRTVADHVVRNARIEAGERVLDIACGTGNTALMARARGAVVTGLDLTPELLAVAAERAAEAGLSDVTWLEGDTEDLPFPDRSFDVVVSSCGLMFAPNQAQVAHEVARVLKPGGRVAIQAWTQAGGVGRLFQITNRFLPPPAGVPSPFAWGDEAGIGSLLGAGFEDLRFERYDCPEFADTAEQVADLYLDWYGPTYRAFRALPPEQAAAYRREVTEFFLGYRAAADGKVRWGREYLLTVARRAGLRKG